MLTNLSSLFGNLPGTLVLMAPETTLDGEPVNGPELPDPEVPAGDPAGPRVPVGEPAAAFHQWKDPTGKVHDFGTADDLSKAMTQSFFLQRDYSQKTDALKGREGQITAREQSMNKQASDLKDLEGKFSSFRKFMTERPELFQQFTDMMQRPGSPAEALSAAKSQTEDMMGEFKDQIKELLDWKAERTWDDQKTGIHGKLAGEIEGYDQEAVENFLTAISGDDPESVYRFAHNALKGQGDDPIARQRAAEQLEANTKNRRILPGSGKAPTPKDFQSLAEGREAALADIGE